MTNKKINIIIADDHRIFLEGLTALLQNSEELCIIASVSNGQEVLDILKVKQADVVLTDVDMPIMDGMKLTKELKKSFPGVKILALTMHNEGRVISSLLKAGVTDIF
jgi:DNA-binding NarL/FixJ family response regulator